jgi:PAS domain S-box-containing protein
MEDHLDSEPPGIVGEALARALFLASPFSTVIYDSEGHLLAVNPAFERLWGAGMAAAPPGYSVLTDPELERQGLVPLIRRAFEGETVMTPPVCYDISRVSTTGAGRVVWTQGYFYPVRDASGRISNVVLTHIDITEQKQAEESLREQEERLRIAQRAAHIGTFDWHIPSGRIAWTEEEERIFGLSPGTFEGTIEAWGRWLLPEDLARMQQVMTDCMQRGEREMNFAFRIRRPDGKVRWIEGSAEFFYAGDGTPLRMIGVNVDVTEQKEADDELLRVKEDAEAASRAKSEFLAVMSHELRTPLNAIGGYAELIELGIRGPVTDAQREDLHRIQQSQRHLLSLINEVLNYARVEAGAVTYDTAEVNVADAVAAADALVIPQMDSKGLKLEVSPIASELVARADREKLQQILLNLLSNATKFTREGGRVGVSAEPAGDLVAIHVWDTGIGIPPERLDSVFEPFVQVGRSLNNPAEGTGLGLAISRDLARGMGGDLHAESMVGVGSTFTLLLPRVEPLRAEA